MNTWIGVTCVTILRIECVRQGRGPFLCMSGCNLQTLGLVIRLEMCDQAVLLKQQGYYEFSFLAGKSVQHRKQLCREGPGYPGGQQVKHKSALSLCNKEGQLLLDRISESLDSR